MTQIRRRPGTSARPTSTTSTLHIQSSASERLRRQRRNRRDHVLTGCRWCCGTADGRAILADATIDELRELWSRLDDEQARDHVAELARQRATT